MRQCFVILPLGFPELETVWEKAYKPVLKKCGFTPIRIDKFERGKILLAEIYDYLNHSQLIIADLTHARPNCYFEVGYAFGAGREEKVVLCCKEDHLGSTSTKTRRIHFDLQAYHVLGWNIRRLKDFRRRLKEKVKTRKIIIDAKETEAKQQAGLVN